MDTSTLNQQFGLSSSLRFSDDSNGLIVAEIDNSLATARICLQGAHLLNWQPHGAAVPIVWLSDSAQLLPGKSPHSGAPVCWPWFGAHASDPGLPAHGYARNLPWAVIATASEANGATRIILRLQGNERARALWPHATTLELTISVGETLRLALTTSNTGDAEITIGEAFHTYFQVGDIAQTRVTGLEGVTYADKVADFARSVQHGPITFSGEVDRVYVDTDAECLIEDPVLQRRIRIAKSGSLATVVWTPGQTKGEQLGDLGPDGWRHMVCVESANAMENQVLIPPGEAHTLAVEYRAEPLPAGSPVP